MDYVKLGSTGLEVSRVCLGCAAYGAPDLGPTPWTLAEQQSRPLIAHALEQGVNFFDTANTYSEGTSEEILGRALSEIANRDEVVIATKLYYRVHSGPNGAGLSRKHIRSQVDASLRRLRTDYIDLLQVHRWDDSTPIEETLEALHDLVKEGKVLHLGASSMRAWQFAKALFTADLHGWTRFVSMQNHFNLLYREEEREMLPLCREEGVAVNPWGSLARGLLARDWHQATTRSRLDDFTERFYPREREADRQVAERVRVLAEERGISRAQIALAWLLHKDGVIAPIVGATKPAHIDDAVAAISIQLTDEEILSLEELYVPHEIVGIDEAPPAVKR